MKAWTVAELEQSIRNLEDYLEATAIGFDQDYFETRAVIGWTTIGCGSIQ
jgi:hypothetical protein